MKRPRKIRAFNRVQPQMTEEDQRKQQFISPSKHKLNPYLMMHFTRTEQYTAGTAVPPWSTSIVYMNGLNSTAAFGVPSITEAAACDTYYSSVSLLLLFNGTNNSIVFTDSGPSPKTVTANGNAKISTTQSKFGGASGYFDGSGDYLSIPTSTDFAFGTGDFTIEMWFYRSGSGQQHLYEGRNGTTTNTILLYINASNQLIYYANGSARISTTSVPTLNTWVHVAVCRSGNSTKLFMDGVQIGSTYTDTLNYAAPTTTLYIGTNDVASGSYLNGYLDDLRVTKGIARYTANFTVPSEENPAAAC